MTEIDILQLKSKILKALSQHKKYADIARELDISKEKAQNLYNHFYTKKVIQATDIIKKTNLEIEYEIYKYPSYSPKMRWELLVHKYSNLIQNLID